MFTLLSIFFSFHLCTLAHSKTQILSPSDFSDPSTFFVYIYYNRPDLECPLCALFNNKISEIPLPIRKVNFYENPFLASHFYIREFPSFVIRHNLKSYRIKADTIEDLFDIVSNRKWINNTVYSICEPDTLFTKVYACIYVVFYYCIEYISEYIESIPTWAMNTVMTFIIAYLVISIVGIFKNK